jgi:hypothetical protein
MKVFSFGVDTLDIFSIVPKLTDASSPVFFAKGIFTPFAENVTVLQLTKLVKSIKPNVWTPDIDDQNFRADQVDQRWSRRKSLSRRSRRRVKDEAVGEDVDQAQPPVSLWKSSWLSCWLLSLLLIERKM